MFTRIKAEREKRGMEQKELAARIGIAVPTLGNYEAGRREPSLDVLCAVADLFDISLDMLVRGKEKTALIGRSIEEIAKAFKALSDEHLELLAQTALNVLAERRFQARQEKEQKETQ